MSCLGHGDREIHLCAPGHSEVTWCADETLVAVRQPLQSTSFQAELFVTASGEGGSLP
jgi:hypothetical protein